MNEDALCDECDRLLSSAGCPDCDYPRGAVGIVVKEMRGGRVRVFTGDGTVICHQGEKSGKVYLDEVSGHTFAFPQD